MQTFVTFKDWSCTAASLDDRRLGKQRVEAAQTLNQLLTGSGGYPHHPINAAWRGYEYGLAVYGMQMCMEWNTKRRFADTMFFHFKRAVEQMRLENPDVAFASPPWRGDADVMRSHRSNLIRKQDAGEVKGTDYRKRFPKTPELMPYLWPFVDKDDKTKYELLVSKADKVRLANGERVLPPEIAERVANL